MFPKGNPGWSLDWKNSDCCENHKDGTLLKFYRQRMQTRLYPISSKGIKSFSVQPDEGFQYKYLPQSHQGSPRYYQNQYLNTMNCVNLICPGTYFITMTANPNWPEIVKSLHENEEWQECPDIVARAFKLKFDELICDLTKRHVMGLCLGFLSVTEFQKRGMPHGHVILLIDPNDAPRTGNEIDQYISAAQLPDQTANPELFEIVTKYMLHGPCSGGYFQREDGSCHFHYPQPFLNETIWESNESTTILYQWPS
eukprot:scaffold1294_cov78-Cylindrotheca_fusiformis.AAC.1